MIKRKYYNFLGIIKRVGKLAAGHDAVIDNFDKAGVILLADDASDRIRERIRIRCEKNQVLFVEYGQSNEYGWALGIKPTVIIAVLDKNFTDALLSKFGNGILFGGEQFGEDKSL